MILSIIIFIILEIIWSIMIYVKGFESGQKCEEELFTKKILPDYIDEIDKLRKEIKKWEKI